MIPETFGQKSANLPKSGLGIFLKVDFQRIFELVNKPNQPHANTSLF